MRPRKKVLIYTGGQWQASSYAFVLGLHYAVSTAETPAEFELALKAGPNAVLLVVGRSARTAVRLGRLAHRRRVSTLGLLLPECSYADLALDATVRAQGLDHVAALRETLANLLARDRYGCKASSTRHHSRRKAVSA